MKRIKKINIDVLDSGVFDFTFFFDDSFMDKPFSSVEFKTGSKTRQKLREIEEKLTTVLIELGLHQKKRGKDADKR